MSAQSGNEHRAGGLDPRVEGLLDRYIDGQMDEGEHRAFEAMVAGDPALKREVALRREAENAILRMFSPPAAAPALPAMVEERKRSSVWRISRPVLAAAAALALTGALVYGYFRYTDPARRWRAQGPGNAVVAYREIVEKAGFKPYWVCTDEAQFMRYAEQQTGSAWVVRAPAEVKLVGWGYVDGQLTPTTTTLLAEVGEEKVIVLAAREKMDRGVEVPKGSGECRLHVFRRQVGDVVLYEITPRREPAVVPFVEQAGR